MKRIKNTLVLAISIIASIVVVLGAKTYFSLQSGGLHERLLAVKESGYPALFLTFLFISLIANTFSRDLYGENKSYAMAQLLSGIINLVGFIISLYVFVKNENVLLTLLFMLIGFSLFSGITHLIGAALARYILKKTPGKYPNYSSHSMRRQKKHIDRALKVSKKFFTDSDGSEMKIKL